MKPNLNTLAHLGLLAIVLALLVAPHFLSTLTTA